jgi:hypothetical protein
MNEFPTRLDDALAALSHVDEADLEPVAASPEWQLLRKRIIAVPRERPRTARSSSRRRFLPRLTAPRLALAAAMTVLAAVGVITLPGSPDESGSADAAVRFKAQGDYLVADVRDPFAAQDELDAAFEAEGLEITLTLVPASPSIVGTVVFIGDEGSGADAIEALDGGACVTGGGACPIGLRIPRDYSGHAEIALGRPARDDEEYASTASGFAPGEALHCKAMPGSTVREILPVLERAYATIEWRDGAGNVLAEAPPGGHIVERVDPMSADSALVWTQDGPVHAPAFREYEARLAAGC